MQLIMLIAFSSKFEINHYFRCLQVEIREAVKIKNIFRAGVLIILYQCICVWVIFLTDSIRLWEPSIDKCKNSNKSIWTMQYRRVSLQKQINQMSVRLFHYRIKLQIKIEKKRLFFGTIQVQVQSPSPKSN